MTLTNEEEEFVKEQYAKSMKEKAKERLIDEMWTEISKVGVYESLPSQETLDRIKEIKGEYNLRINNL